jgi:ribonuclease HI
MMMMDGAEESFEWRSVVDALRAISVDKRTTLGTQGVVAYTDGACIKNPGGPAGWSVMLFAAEDFTNGLADVSAVRIECYGHIPASQTTTNNRAEITAVLAALSIAPLNQPLTVYSDSEYTIKAAQGLYKIKVNTDLWSLYRMLLNRRNKPPVFEWVRGHAGHELNERADELAGLGAWKGDIAAYQQWQASTAFEAHNDMPAAELGVIRQQVQRLKALFDSIDVNNPRIGTQERQFITDMANRLQKNNFSPSPKQSNWIKGLVAKYKV